MFLCVVARRRNDNIVLYHVMYKMERRRNEGRVEHGLVSSLLADRKWNRGRMLETKQIKSAKDLRVYKKAYALAMEIFNISKRWSMNMIAIKSCNK